MVRKPLAVLQQRAHNLYFTAVQTKTDSHFSLARYTHCANPVMLPCVFNIFASAQSLFFAICIIDLQLSLKCFQRWISLERRKLLPGHGI